MPARLRGGRARALERLVAAIESHADWISKQILEHRTLRVRGFDVEKPEDFERVARLICATLGNDYLGTSPRDQRTDYVFNASELPDYFPIPQHCEMSFRATPPPISTLLLCGALYARKR